jgi:catechol 2,3-dioxygenase-like lactoylglutathione lyase family enzyme
MRACITFLFVLLALPVAAQPAAEPKPLLKRIKMVTVGAPDVGKAQSWYKDGFGYRVREEGKVPPALAESWGAPKAAGRPMVLMSTDASPDVFIRIVETAAVPGYKPMTSWGWNSFELVINDIDAVHARMKGSPFTVLGEPAPLKSSPSIKVMQVQGPANDVWYMANETGDRTKSTLPDPGGPIGRPFIVILAGADIEKVRDWYADVFQIAKASIRESGGKVVPHALGLPEGSSLPISLLALGEPGNRIQLDGYKTYGVGARPRTPGHLPPGNAMVSFSVDDLGSIKATTLAKPASIPGAGYQGARTATLAGPAGELIELIEEKRP